MRNIMENIRERRNFKRFAIPNATVKYNQEEGFHESKAVSGMGKLMNISVNAVRFETQHVLVPGAVTILELNVKGKEPIHILGNILWVSGYDNSTSTNAIVQFFPFGIEHGYNTIESKLQLELLNKEFAA
jgi:hypothetical protein